MVPAFPKKPANLFLSPFLIALFFLAFLNGYAQVGINTVGDPTSTLEVNGSFAQKVNTVTANTSLTIDNAIVICNNGATEITITLPSPAGISGRTYSIKRNATSTANVTIAGTINGATNLILTAAGQTETLFSDGTEWKSLSNYDTSSATTGWSLTGNTGTTAGTNYIGTTDAKDLVLKTNATSRVNVTSAGVTTIGNIATGDISKIEADGTLKFEGEAGVWDDLRVSLDKGSSSATIDYIWGSEGPQIYFFRNNAVSAMSFVVQIPHSWKEGTTIYPHIHWMPRTTGTGNMVWNFDYSWQNYNPTTPLAFPTYTTNTIVTEGPFTANTHRISSLVPAEGLTVAENKISSILICRIWRDPANTDDTYSADAGVLSFDIHFQIDTVGSRATFVK